MSQNTHILLVIDAINQLNPFYGAHSMDWFPTFLPRGIQALLSTTPESDCLTSLSTLL